MKSRQQPRRFGSVSSVLVFGVLLLLWTTTLSAGAEVKFSSAAVQPSSVAAESEGVAEVTEVFRSYKAALMAGDGAAAAGLVDAATFDYFAALKELAIDGDEATVKERPFVDRLLIISMRQIMSRDELRSLKLGELMDRAVSEGWISTQSVSQLDIGEVTVKGDRATARAISLNPAVALNGSTEETGEETVQYQFVREQGAWKFGFSSLVTSLNRMVEEFTAQLGTDQDELIFVLVEALTGKPVLPQVWQNPSAAEAAPDEPPNGN